MDEPAKERLGFVGVAGRDHCGYPDAGIARPGIAVIPIADAGDLLGKRGRRGGHRGARRCVGKQTQRDQRADEQIGVREARAELGAPLVPPAFGAPY